MSSGTKKRVEFVRTADASKATKTWGSFAKSWMSSSSKSNGSSKSAESASAPAVDAEVVCGADGGAAAGPVKAMSELYTCNNPNFEALLGCYWTRYAEAPYRALLASGH